jgi:ferrochelatase
VGVVTDAGGDLGVLLMTYGSPSSLDDVPRYLAAVRGGRPAAPAIVEEFTRRYRLIGGSPLIAITADQARALQARLGDDIEVASGMRFSEPTIERAVTALAAAGARRVVAIVLSPQYSPLLMGGYRRALDAAVGTLGDRAPDVTVAGPWHDQPAFIAALADRIRSALAHVHADERDGVPVLLTAHSLPLRVAREEPEYLGQLEATARAVAERAGLGEERWRFCWQSAGHEPGEWMKPDFADLMPRVREAGHETVLVAPVQFLSDHLEVLYDIDIGAREQAEAAGLRLARIESLNTDPGLIEALATVVRATAAAGPRDPTA